MMLTIYTLFNDPNIVNAVIQRVLQTRKDTIYWQQYLDFRRTTTRVFKDYIGQVTGVMAGSINSRYGEKPIRERRNIGSGYGEIAYLGDRYQISIDRLSELQDLVDKFNAAKTADQVAAMQDIVNFIYDDYRQVLLAAHKRMDIVVGSLLMTGKAQVKNKDDNAGGIDLLDIELPFKFITPEAGAKANFITYLQTTINELKAVYGTFPKMIMSRGTFVKNIIGSSYFPTGLFCIYRHRASCDRNQGRLCSGPVGKERSDLRRRPHHPAPTGQDRLHAFPHALRGRGWCTGTQL